MTLTAMPKYDAYIDSGVEWLGKIPHDWTLISLNRTVVGCVNGLWGNEPNGVNDIVVLRVADFERNKLKINDQKLTVRSIPLKDRYGRLLKNGDLLIEKSGGGDKTLVGCVVLFDKAYDAITSNFVAKMTPKDNFDARFLCYLFSALYSSNVNYRSIKQTTGIQNLDSGAYLSEVAAFPLLPTQTAIANFLDTKTTQIDEAIAIKEQQIALLNERKQILIQQAVTQGLDPTVPMKDSGVEWIGKIPEHWQFSQIRKLTSTTSGSTPSSGNVSAYYNGHIPWVRTTDLNDNELIDVPEKITERAIRETSCKIIPISSVCVAMYGGAGTIGKHAITRFSGSLNQAVCAILPCEKLVQDYLFYYVKFYRPHWMISAKGSRVDPNISQDQVRRMPITVPSINEQKEIVCHIENQSVKMDNLIKQEHLQIEKLKEYKTTLINSAVTGKIKVV